MMSTPVENNGYFQRFCFSWNLINKIDGTLIDKNLRPNKCHHLSPVLTGLLRIQCDSVAKETFRKLKAQGLDRPRPVFRLHSNPQLQRDIGPLTCHHTCSCGQSYSKGPSWVPPANPLNLSLNVSQSPWKHHWVQKPCTAANLLISHEVLS